MSGKSFGEMALQIDGLDVTVRRKRIKRLNLRVMPPNGRVEVGAPLTAALGEIEAFVRQNMSWVRQKQQDIAMRPPPKPQKIATGEPVTVWGKEYELLVVLSSGKTDAWLAGGRLVLSIPEGSTAQKRTALLSRWYRDELERVALSLVPRLEARVGQRAAEWRFKAMKTRWGSCNTRERRIWLNLELAKKPPECLEYVMLHELTHLWEPNHGFRFKALLTRFCPDWQRRRDLLNST